MSDPYEILGISPAADEAQIRGRYLDLVREFPPDRDPERFAEIRAAFDELRNPLVRLQREIFDLGHRDTLASLETELRTRLRKARLSVDALLSFADAP